MAHDTQVLTGRRRSYVPGLAMLAVAILLPLVSTLRALSDHAEPPQAVPLPIGRDTASFDFKAGQRGWYLLKIKGTAVAHDDYDGLGYDHGLNCMLGLPQLEFWPQKCAGQPAPLRFHYTLTGKSGHVDGGDYHEPGRFWSVFVDGDNRFAGAEFASLPELPAGTYHLALSGLQVPAGLALRKPVLALEQQPNDFDVFPGIVWLTVLTCCLMLGATALGMLGWAYSSRRQRSKPGR